MIEDETVTGSESEVQRESGKASPGSIVKKVWIKASPETVFSALTESRQLIHWFCDKASCDPREGGELTAYWKSGKEGRQGRALITRIVPGRVLELLWIDEGRGQQENGPRHTLSYEIRSKSGMTELVMHDRDDACLGPEANDFFTEGWNAVLLELKDYCERKERSARPRQRDRASAKRE